jgi:hypothetical protein
MREFIASLLVAVLLMSAGCSEISEPDPNAPERTTQTTVPAVPSEPTEPTVDVQATGTAAPVVTAEPAATSVSEQLYVIGSSLDYTKYTEDFVFRRVEEVIDFVQSCKLIENVFIRILEENGERVQVFEGDLPEGEFSFIVSYETVNGGGCDGSDGSGILVCRETVFGQFIVFEYLELGEGL